MTDNSDREGPSTPRKLWAILGPILGVLVYVVFNVVVGFYIYGSPASGPPLGALMLIAVTTGMLVLAVRNRNFRPFGAGFVFAFALITVASAGQCTLFVDRLD